LTGDLNGAIEDLEFAVEWASESNQDQRFIVDRRFWLLILKMIQFFRGDEVVLDDM
jgi:hypothetical protein